MLKAWTGFYFFSAVLFLNLCGISNPALGQGISPIREDAVILEEKELTWNGVHAATAGLPLEIQRICEITANNKNPSSIREEIIKQSGDKNNDDLTLFKILFGENVRIIDSSRVNYMLSKLCVDRVIDNGLEVMKGYPLWKNLTGCTQKVELNPYNFQVMFSLLGSGLLRGVELGCIDSGAIHIRDVDFDFFVIKNSDILRINVQNSMIGSFDLHNSKIGPQSEDRSFDGTLNFQGVNITKRLIVSRTDLAGIRIFASSISDAQIYDFYPDKRANISEDDWTNDIGYINISHSELNNIRLGSSTKLTNLFIDSVVAENLYLGSHISGFARVSETNVVNSLEIEADPSSTLWGDKSYLDLSSTRSGSFSAAENSFKRPGESGLIPVNFSGFNFANTGNFIPDQMRSGPQVRIISDMEISSLIEWLRKSSVFFLENRGVSVQSRFPYRLADSLDNSGNSSRANDLRIAAKSAEWRNRSYIGWIVGHLTGFGYATHRLLWVLIALVFVGWVVKVVNGYKNQIYSRKGIGSGITHIAEDLIFSMDRLLPPLIVQKQWDSYPDLGESARLYFYFHRVAGSLILVLGAFSLARAF